MNSGYGITFGTEGSSRFGNDFAGNAVIFAADNSSSFHTSILIGKITLGVDNNDSSGAAEKKIINFTKEKTKFC